MTIDDQMRADIYYRRETVPIALTALAFRIAQHYGVPDSNLGTRGNLAHRKGYHRSRDFVRNSPLCTDDRYSVSRTNGDDNGGSDFHVSAIDIQIPRAELLLMCKRLDKAVRAGKLEKVTEWYGNTDGDDRVDGYDNIANRVATSDSSHLWHLHISIDRAFAASQHSDLFTILTGGATMAGFTDLVRDQYIASISERVIGFINGDETIAYRVPGSERDYAEPNQLQAQLDRIEAKVDADVDIEAIGAAIARYLIASDLFLSEVAGKVSDRILASIEVAGAVEVKLRNSTEGH